MLRARRQRDVPHVHSPRDRNGKKKHIHHQTGNFRLYPHPSTAEHLSTKGARITYCQWQYKV